jgi:hypothetical protein
MALSTASSHLTPYSVDPTTPAPSQTVPIFALNSKGSYYVPMSVDIGVIRPYMSLYTEDSCPVLHPVTISVNFQAAHIQVSKPTPGVIHHQQQSVIKHWRDQPSV